MMSCSEVERVTGAHPLLLSCWACLMGPVPDAHLELLMSPPGDELLDVPATHQMQQERLGPLTQGLSLPGF